MLENLQFNEDFSTPSNIYYAANIFVPYYN